MTMPASLLGFGILKALERKRLLFGESLAAPFGPVENVLVQTVAGSMAIMPLGCGFVGVVSLFLFFQGFFFFFVFGFLNSAFVPAGKAKGSERLVDFFFFFCYFSGPPNNCYMSRSGVDRKQLTVMSATDTSNVLPP